MSEKYESASAVTIDAAQFMYSIGVATIVTDGKYIEIEKEVDKE